MKIKISQKILSFFLVIIFVGFFSSIVQNEKSLTPEGCHVSSFVSSESMEIRKLYEVTEHFF